MRINQAVSRVTVLAEILNYKQWKMKVGSGLTPA